MHIIEIIIDGFKSYSARTHIENFDKSFNAITGRNGSGKSTILDAICFVMGISRLSLIRVAQIQELVYKGGNSSVRQAQVTIYFDNADKSSSPPGYEKCAKISVGRSVANNKVKCYIDGKLATQAQVKNLFCSVHLNVSSPHFLVMQGRITKIANNRSRENLALVEEASGAALCQQARTQTKALIAKKEQQIRAAARILSEDVGPQ